jgi:glycosyltransferase involved in cell wall biosynthesis
MRSDLPVRPTLGILDLSDGPSGLSRYLEILWPALTDSFRVVIFGDVQGPYTSFPDAIFHAVRRSPTRSRPREQPACPSPSPSDVPSHSHARVRIGHRVWRQLAPPGLKYFAGFVRDASRLAGGLRSHAVDLCYIPVCFAESTVLAARLARFPRVLGTLHLPPAPRPGVDSRLVRYTARNLDHAIAVSQRVGRAWTDLCPRLQRRTTIIPNGIETPPYAPRPCRERFGLPVTGRPLFVAAGRLAEQKGFRFLVEAVRQLDASGPRAVFAIAGTGPLKSALHEQIDRLGLRDDVYLLDQCPDMDSLYRCADGFVLSSVSEAMPYVLLEAMAHGLPVVATSVGGVPEMIRDGVNGRLVPPGDPVALADAIRGLLAAPDCQARLGAAARETVEADFSAEAMRSRTVGVIWRLLRSRVRSRSRCWQPFPL